MVGHLKTETFVLGLFPMTSSPDFALARVKFTSVVDKDPRGGMVRVQIRGWV